RPAASASASARPDAAPPADETSAEAGAKPVESASSVPPPPPQDLGDGGVRPSPLNPTVAESPGGADAGVPPDYDRILADVAALRARVSAVSDNLYQSRVAVAVQVDGDHARIARLAVSLDDGVVYTAPQSFAASDARIVYDHAVAPGRHAVTVDIDRRDDRDDSFRTSQRNRFTIDVPRDNKVDVVVKIVDDSSMGKDFPGDRSGTYDLRVRVKAVAKPATGK
ncbi:MAG: hypothetical protein JWP97_6716, partial [Labilithrix sp.]|nr:hypothetical protein [Labilithrix sp.]